MITTYTKKLNPQGNIVVEIPGDKSISHRAIIFASLSSSTVNIHNLLLSDDVECTINAFRDMGVRIETKQTVTTVYGVGINGLKRPERPLYMGNSGTACRLLIGLLSAQKFDTVVTGDASLSQRPMERVIEPLKLMGANLSSNNGKLPIHIESAVSLNPISYLVPKVSAQIKSSLLLAALYIDGVTRITELKKTRTYTESMMQSLIGNVEVNGLEIQVNKASKYQMSDFVVPSDMSSASFFLVAGLISKSLESLTVKNVDYSNERNGLIRNLLRMGAKIDITSSVDSNNANITVKPSKLVGNAIPESDVADMIDEFPILMVSAIDAIGTTTVSGAEELRVKESDRIDSMVGGFEKIGISVKSSCDGFILEGKQTMRTQKQAIDSHHDHRIAMSFVILLSLCNLGETIKVLGAETIKTSFPNFNVLIKKLGIERS